MVPVGAGGRSMRRALYPNLRRLNLALHMESRPDRRARRRAHRRRQPVMVPCRVPCEEELAPHVFEAMEYQFLVHADDREDGVKVLTANVFSRYFCEVLFRHFDKNNNGVLELAEMHEALKFLVKPDADGNQLMPVVAFPPEFCDEDGQVKLPITWFWECVRVRHRT